MNCEILASVMNQKNCEKIIQQFNISEKNKCLIINQITEGINYEKNITTGNHRFFSVEDKGLSKSRNMAIEKAMGDICIIADDDVEYVENYEKIVKDGYSKYPDADIIAYHFKYVDCKKYKRIKKEGRVGYLRSLGISSTQITFKRDSLQQAKIKFDENFGTGSGKCNWGEENVLLYDCLKAGLKIYYIPMMIAKKYDYGSTWDRSNTPEHFEKQGWLYYRMTRHFYWILGLQFAIRKRNIFKKEMTSWQVFTSILKGGKQYRRMKNEGKI